MSDKPKKKVDFFKYQRHYNPQKEGYGNAEQWRASFEGMNPERAKLIVADDSPLALLGLSEMPTLLVLKTAYRKLVMLHHPDKGGDANKFMKIHAAYTLLLAQIK